MKELQNFKLTDRLGLGVKPALAYLEKALQALQFVDFKEIPIAAFLDQNLTADDYGNVTITVKTLEREVEIQGADSISIFMRNQAGALQISTDRVTWQAIGGSGATETLTDGTHSVTALQVQDHIADSTLHYAQTAIDHAAISHRGSNDHAAIDAHLADPTLHLTSAGGQPTAMSGRVVTNASYVEGNVFQVTLPGAPAMALVQIITPFNPFGYLGYAAQVSFDGGVNWCHLPTLDLSNGWWCNAVQLVPAIFHLRFGTATTITVTQFAAW